MLADFQVKIIDQDALTIKEIAAHIGLNPNNARIKAEQKVSRNEWEKVWKRVGSYTVPAYRIKKK